MLHYLFKYVTTPDKKNPSKYSKTKYLTYKWIFSLVAADQASLWLQQGYLWAHIKILKHCTLRSQAWSGSLNTLPTLTLWVLNLLSGKGWELDCTYRPHKPLMALSFASEDLHLLSPVNTSAPCWCSPRARHAWEPHFCALQKPLRPTKCLPGDSGYPVRLFCHWKR